MNFVRVQ